MPGSPTTPGRPGTRAPAPVRIAFRDLKRVGTQEMISFAAQWLACTLPCRRFVPTLADDNARLGAEVGRYTFLAVDSHHLLLAGLPGALRFDLSSTFRNLSGRGRRDDQR